MPMHVEAVCRNRECPNQDECESCEGTGFSEYRDRDLAWSVSVEWGFDWREVWRGDSAADAAQAITWACREFPGTLAVGAFHDDYEGRGLDSETLRELEACEDCEGTGHQAESIYPVSYYPATRTEVGYPGPDICCDGCGLEGDIVGEWVV